MIASVYFVQKCFSFILVADAFKLILKFTVRLILYKPWRYKVHNIMKTLIIAFKKI